MATYKVIQDIEAEDKFVGPLSLRQFVFAMAGSFFGWLCVIMAAKVGFWVILLFGPLSLLGFFMAVPWSKDQPTEVWVLAKLRFYFKPKKRIWDQFGQQNLVTITAPKKIEKNLTKNFSQAEVKSRLETLAETIDSRGWAVKHATMQNAIENYHPVSDRLVSVDALPKAVPDVDLASVPDMLDASTSSSSANLEQMMESKDQERRAGLIDKMERIRRGESLDKIHQAEQAVAQSNDALQPIGTREPLQNPLRSPSKKSPVAPTDDSQAQVPLEDSALTGQAPMTTPVRPDIIDLARNNDLNVATIARQANQSDDENEVVISLH